jgi:hypothetical protein
VASFFAQLLLFSHEEVRVELFASIYPNLLEFYSQRRKCVFPEIVKKEIYPLFFQNMLAI